MVQQMDAEVTVELDDFAAAREGGSVGYGSLNAKTLPLVVPDITATYCTPSIS
jgi:hypothetical protein